MQLSDLFFTPRCVFCQRLLGVGAEERVCPWCHPERYQITGPRCRRCGRPAATEGALCRDCQLHPAAICGHSLYAYDGIIRESIHRFKYDQRKGYAAYYAAALSRGEASYIREVNPELLVPVPLHRTRQRERGYNQSAVLARELSRLCGIPWAEILWRTRATAPQKGLGYGMRQRNTAEAFAVKQEAAVPDRILLIDDIYTTGSTVAACADAVWKVKPKAELSFLTIAAKIFEQKND